MRRRGGKTAPATAARHDTELARLLDELEGAGCFADGLAMTADLVGGQVIDIIVRAHGMKSQDGECLQWALEEMKTAVTRMRDAAEDLAEYLKAGSFQPGGPPAG